MLTFTASWFFPGHIFWFVFGITFKFQLMSIKSWLERNKWKLLILSMVLIPLGIIEWELILWNSQQDWLTPKRTLVDEIYSLIFLLSFLAFSNFQLPFSKQINYIGTKSYGIYLVHSPVLEYTSRGIYHIAPWMLGTQFLFQPILIALGVSIPLLLMKILERSPARRLLSIYFWIKQNGFGGIIND